MPPTKISDLPTETKKESNGILDGETPGAQVSEEVIGIQSIPVLSDTETNDDLNGSILVCLTTSTDSDSEDYDLANFHNISTSKVSISEQNFETEHENLKHKDFTKVQTLNSRRSKIESPTNYPEARMYQEKSLTLHQPQPQNEDSKLSRNCNSKFFAESESCIISNNKKRTKKFKGKVYCKKLKSRELSFEFTSSNSDSEPERSSIGQKKDESSDHKIKCEKRENKDDHGRKGGPNQSLSSLSDSESSIECYRPKIKTENWVENPPTPESSDLDEELKNQTPLKLVPRILSSSSESSTSQSQDEYKMVSPSYQRETSTMEIVKKDIELPEELKGKIRQFIDILKFMTLDQDLMKIKKICLNSSRI